MPSPRGRHLLHLFGGFFPLGGQFGDFGLHGFEFGLKQAFTFLPGWLASFGADVNYTYSPSTTGHDVSGQAIPFQDNSRDQANVVLWYEHAGFQARLANRRFERRRTTAE